MAQLKKIENTMSDHPELEELLKSVDLSDWFDDKQEENDEKEKDNNINNKE